MKNFLFFLLIAPCFAFAQVDKKKQVFTQLLSGSGSVTFCSEYQAILDRATTLGYTLPSAGQQVKQNTFLEYLKTNSIWTALDRLWVFATDGSSDFARIDWKNPSGDLALAVNSPTFSSNTGFTGNGSSSYLRTQFIPGTEGVNYTLNSACAFFGGKINSTFKYGIGQQAVANLNGVHIGGNATADVFRINGTNFTANVIPTSTQVFAYVDRTDASNCRYSINGASPTTVANASTQLPSIEVYIHALNNNGSASGYNDQPCNIVGFGASINPVTFYTGWNTYLTSL